MEVEIAAMQKRIEEMERGAGSQGISGWVFRAFVESAQVGDSLRFSLSIIQAVCSDRPFLGCVRSVGGVVNNLINNFCGISSVMSPTNSPPNSKRSIATSTHQTTTL
jgi:hypothetical protein